jgi:two-component system sensor histidine kinase MprB
VSTPSLPSLPRWHYRRSLASRVILLTTFSVGVAMAFAAMAVYVTVRMQMQETLDESLRQRAERAAESPALSDLAVTHPEVPSWALGAADVRIAFLYASERVDSLADDGPQLVLGPPEYAVATGDSGSSVRTIIAGDGSRYRVVAVPANQPGQALVIAQSLAPQEKVLAKLGAVMLFFGVVGVLVAGAVGWAVARNGLRPVRRLTSSVEEIARTEDLRPLPVEGDDEIARLAISFNQMLTALAASRDRQRRLVADAGHELRTPLTSLRTNIDLLTQADRGDLPDLAPTARAELLDDVRAQIEELTTLIGDLVELARDEPVPLVVEPVDLAEVVDRAVGRVRRRAPGVTFDVDLASWWVVGEASSLERAVTNLLDNAAKWSPEGGTVRVRLADGELVVDDEGPGIAPEDVPHVFERFWRSQESRAMPGSGLGLAIVDQVVGRHAGTVVASASPAGGTRMAVALPGSVDAPVAVS